MATWRKVPSSVSIDKCSDADEDIACNMDEGLESVTNRTNRQQRTLAENGCYSKIPNWSEKIVTDNALDERNLLVEDQEV